MNKFNQKDQYFGTEWFNIVQGEHSSLHLSCMVETA